MALIIMIYLKHLINQLKFNYRYTLDLISDVDENQMAYSPSPGLENHPMFTVGHLITAYGLTNKYIGGKYTISKEWDSLFRRKGPGDPRYPTKKVDLYPTKEELVSEFRAQHESLLTQISKLSSDQLNDPCTWRYSVYFPKLIDLLYFMCMTHYSMHIGQLAAWRRAVDLPSSLARL
jgi:hypothetical protein